MPLRAAQLPSLPKCPTGTLEEQARQLQDWQSGAGAHPLEVVSVQRLNKPRLVT